MSVHLHVTLDLAPGQFATFAEAMSLAVPILTGLGWTLVGAFAQRTGDLNRVIDLWELRDFNHFDEALKGLMAHPAFPAIKANLERSVTRETIVFADRIQYGV